MTLTEFLLARIAKDEDVALDAQLSKGYGEWEYATVNYSGRIQTVLTTGTSPEYAEHISITHDREGLSDSVSDNAGPHIARHDPARVLAECEAKRRIVGYRGRPIGLPADGTVPLGEGMTYLNGGHAAVAAERDRILRLLALPYADHPDYDEAWRP